jgi:hypothetical protein
MATLGIAPSTASAIHAGTAGMLGYEMKQDSSVIDVRAVARGGAVRRTTVVGPRGGAASRTVVL